MATQRKIVFRNDYIYHVFNRGIERRSTFNDRNELNRATQLLKFYRHKGIPIRFSKVMQQPENIRNKIFDELYKSEQIVKILSYCLMPNHFHFLLKQTSEGGIPRFISNFTNAYTKYFNTKYKRVGPLFQGIFKAVLIESDEQLIHVSRYIHLNPVTSSIIEKNHLEKYYWSSYPEYISTLDTDISDKEMVLEMFKSVEDYKKFVEDQIDYAKKLDLIKHIISE